MAIIFILYTLLNILVFGCVLLFARAKRLRARADERVDLEDNSIIAEEWDLLRRLQCQPTRCRRALGNPARPRKDVTCEICAALFMERYWRSQLSGGSPRRVARRPKSGSGRAGARARDRGVAGGELITLECDTAPDGVPHRERAARTSGLWRRGAVLFAAGFVCVVAGALLGLLSSFLLPGYLVVIVGIGLLIAGAVSEVV